MTQLDLDLQQLYAQPPFRRFLLHIARTAGIFAPTSGAIETLPFREGQRSLGLDIIRLAARGAPRNGSMEQMLAVILASETNLKETDDETAEPSDLNR